MKARTLALAAACALSATFAPAAGAQAMDEVVRMQLDAAVELVTPEGYTQQGAFRAGALDAGESESLRVELQAGKEYVIVGVCDGDCSDLDLAVVNAAGAELASDYELDDVPLLQLQVPSAGGYGLVVSMAACSIEPCGYGVAIFARDL